MERLNDVVHVIEGCPFGRCPFAYWLVYDVPTDHGLVHTRRVADIVHEPPYLAQLPGIARPEQLHEIADTHLDLL